MFGSYGQGLHGEDQEDLSEELVELKNKPLHEQGVWWRKTAASLEPFAIGKTGRVTLDYDLLGRYFNGTSMGLNFIADKAKNRDGAAGNKYFDEEALAQIFVTHFGFLNDSKNWRDALSNEAFLSFCRTLGAHDGAKASQASMRYAARRLRIGALLYLGMEEQSLYHYDYDSESVSGSFKAPMMGNKGDNVQHASAPLASPRQVRVRKQKSMLHEEEADGLGDDLDKNYHEYLLSNPQQWPGDVHWVHAHRPSKMLVLALGQQHHLRIHAQGLLCRLTAVHPQHNFGHARQGSGSPDWFLMTFPAVVLDHLARQSLQNFKKWQKAAVAKARQSQEVDDEPPPVYVGVISYPAALVWSAPKAHDTVLSMTGDAEYIGKWSNFVPPSEQTVQSRLVGSCCPRRKRKDGYEELSQKDDADDMETALYREVSLGHEETRCMDKINLHMTEQQAEKEGSFENIFANILLLLAESNSLLRMGTHLQLACRILLSWTASHVEVVQLYEAAIARMQHHLSQKDHPDKEILISKISMAKLEISSLIRSLTPFVTYVLPDFHTHLSEGADHGKGDLSQVIRMHHLVDIENNLRQTMQDLEAQRNLCDSIIGEYDRKSADKVNNILNFLTLITFLVMPVQILTGIYGMNFKVMPELEWKYGYPHYFVGAGFIGTVVFATFLCIYRSMV